ncbi:hypothetical protein QBC39DRAFT_372631 [Podospora conica]|nr:hypothetical protein QBC39DRAFT_372631 [Schizothecium conicum]
MATLERLRIRKPRPQQVNGVVRNGPGAIKSIEETKRVIETLAQQAERQQTESWIRALKVKLRLVLQSGQPALNSVTGDGRIPAQETTIAEPNLATADAQTQDATKWNVELPLSSEKLYCIPQTNIFVALPTEVPVPPEAQELFDKQFKSLLLADLEEAKRYIESTSTGKRDPNNYIFEPLVLRMSGSPASRERDGTVTLSPTIWVRCSPAQQKGMRKALQKSCMKWAHNTEFGEIVVSAARLLSSNPPGWWEVPTGTGSAINSFEGFTLHFEIEDPSARHQETPLHGILCRATIMHGSVIFSQNLSRIGGLITVNGRTLGLTSAHGIFGSMWDMLQSDSDIQGDLAQTEDEHASSDGGSSDGGLSNPDDDDIDQESSDESAHDYSCYTEFTLKPPDPVEAKSTSWLEVHLGGAANFLGQKAILAAENTDLSTIIFIKDVLNFGHQKHRD